METQNITLSLPRALIKRAKIVAAKRETSVSALVAGSLEEIVRNEDDLETATQRTLARARRGYDLGSRGAIAATREQLHER